MLDVSLGDITPSLIQLETYHVVTLNIERATETEGTDEMEIGRRPMLR